jgi:hypothetical protein
MLELPGSGDNLYKCNNLSNLKPISLQFDVQLCDQTKDLRIVNAVS